MKLQSFAMKRSKDIANIPTPRSAAHLVPPYERAAAGKVLRDKIPRNRHGEWNAVQGRPNPIDLAQFGRRSNKEARPDPIWPYAAIAVCLLSWGCWGYGFRRGPNANHGPKSASVR